MRIFTKNPRWPLTDDRARSRMAKTAAWASSPQSTADDDRYQVVPIDHTYRCDLWERESMNEREQDGESEDEIERRFIY